MARLVVYRGETLDRELELSRLPFRIGRAATNDLVLEDPGKSVSREHAEIRVEGGRFVLVDRQSENGIWVSGTKRSVVPLERDVVASIGPFRLKVEGPPPAAPFDDAVTVARTIPAGVLPTPPPVPAPAASSANPVGSDDIIGGLVNAAPPPPPPPPSYPAATQRPAPPPPPRARTSSPGKPANRQSWIVGAGAALVLVLLIAIGMMIVRAMREASTPPVDVSNYISSATQQLGQGACADALSQSIQPGLAADPANAELLRLKEMAEACAAAVPVQGELSAAQAAANTLLKARGLITENDCAAALSEINFLLTTLSGSAELQAARTEAEAIKVEAEKCAPPPVTASVGGAPTTPRAASVAATRIPPESGGLEPLPNERQADYQKRVDEMRARYDAAVAAAERTPNRATIAALEAILRDTAPRYLEIQARISQARAANRAAAGRAFGEGREAANRKQWKAAMDKFNQALEIDPSLAGDVNPEIARTNEAMIADGEAACARARLVANYPNQQAEAPALWERVLQTLPQDHRCYALAKTALGR